MTYENIIYKHPAILQAFDYIIDPRLKALLHELSKWVYNNCEGKSLTITCLNRTVEENERVNGYKYSAHLIGRAVDIRSRYFTDDEIKRLIEHLKYSWGDMVFVKYHDVGFGNHIHINITRKYHIRNYVKE